MFHRVNGRKKFKKSIVHLTVISHILTPIAHASHITDEQEKLKNSTAIYFLPIEPEGIPQTSYFSVQWVNETLSHTFYHIKRILFNYSKSNTLDDENKNLVFHSSLNQHFNEREELNHNILHKTLNIAQKGLKYVKEHPWQALTFGLSFQVTAGAAKLFSLESILNKRDINLNSSFAISQYSTENRTSITNYTPFGKVKLKRFDDHQILALWSSRFSTYNKSYSIVDSGATINNKIISGNSSFTKTYHLDFFDNLNLNLYLFGLSKIYDNFWINIKDNQIFFTYSDFDDIFGTKIDTKGQIASVNISSDINRRESSNPSVINLSNDQFLVSWDFLDSIFGRILNSSSLEFLSESFNLKDRVGDIIEDNGDIISSFTAKLSDNTNLIYGISGAYHSLNYRIYGKLFNNIFDSSDNFFISNNSGFVEPFFKNLGQKSIILWKEDPYYSNNDKNGYLGRLISKNGILEKEILNITEKIDYRGDFKSISFTPTLDNKLISLWHNGSISSDLKSVICGCILNSDNSNVSNTIYISNNSFTDQINPSAILLSDNKILISWTNTYLGSRNSDILGRLMHSDGTFASDIFKISDQMYYDGLSKYPNDFSSGLDLNESVLMTWIGNLDKNIDTDGSLIYSDTVIGKYISYDYLNSISYKETIFPKTSSSSTNNNFENNQSTNNQSTIGAAVGGSLGGLALVGLGGGFLWKYLKNQQQKEIDEIELGSTPRSPRKSRKSGFDAVRGTGIFDARMVIEGSLYGHRYALFFKFDESEANLIQDKTGLNFTFPSQQKKMELILGQGQFGQVRLAREVETPEKNFVAIKIIAGEKSVDASLREGRLQARLNDAPNVLPLLDYLHYLPTPDRKKEISNLLKKTFGKTEIAGIDMTEQPLLLQITPLAAFGDGEVLRKKLFLMNDFEFKNKLLISTAYGLLNGLSAMHDQGISHLDIKPSNLLISNDGMLYISDFGCAQQKDYIKGGIGDFRYYSPERLAHIRHLQITKNPQTHYPNMETANKFSGKRADAWAAGLTLLEIIKNRFPFNFYGVPDQIKTWNINKYRSLLQTDAFNDIDVKYTILPIVKGLLNTHEKERLSIKDALKMIQSLHDPIEDSKSFIEFKNKLIDIQSSTQSPPESIANLYILSDQAQNSDSSLNQSQQSENIQQGYYGNNLDVYDMMLEVYKNHEAEGSYY